MRFDFFFLCCHSRCDYRSYHLHMKMGHFSLADCIFSNLVICVFKDKILFTVCGPDLKEHKEEEPLLSGYTRQILGNTSKISVISPEPFPCFQPARLFMWKMIKGVKCFNNN